MATHFPSETLYSTREAAEYLGYAEDTVRKYIKRGLIFAEKLGPVYAVRQSECDRYKRNRREIGHRQPTKK